MSHWFSGAISDINVPALSGEDFDGRAPPDDSTPKESLAADQYHTQVATASPPSNELCSGTLSFLIQHLIRLKTSFLEDRLMPKNVRVKIRVEV